MADGGFYRKGGKRVLDAVAAVVLLLFGLPLLLVLWLVVRVSLGKPALFRQWRPGWKGHPFLLVKFRTMRDVLGADGASRPDEERLTATGRFLRSVSLDELPELWNVLKGDMSLVGPRPLLMEYLPLYTKRHRRRHDVRPGMSGWAQVNGRNAVGWEERFEMDMWYVERLSFALDARIILLTLREIALRKGISAAEHATMPKFTGTGASS